MFSRDFFSHEIMISSLRCHAESVSAKPWSSLITVNSEKERNKRRGIGTKQGEKEHSLGPLFGRGSDGLGLQIGAAVSWGSVVLGCGLGLPSQCKRRYAAIPAHFSRALTSAHPPAVLIASAPKSFQVLAAARPSPSPFLHLVLVRFTPKDRRP